MINNKYKDMLKAKSAIRELSEYAAGLAKEIGYENVFDFTLGNPGVEPPEEFARAVNEVYNAMSPMEIHGYSPTNGILSVKKAIADSLKNRFKLDYAPEHIFPASGAAAAISHAVRAVTEPGDKVLGFAPFFPEYIHYVEGSGARFIPVRPDLNDFMPDMAEFKGAIDEKVSAVLINSPNNPSGVIYSEEVLRELSEILREKAREYNRSIYLISDEPYREICYLENGAPYPSKYYDNTISCYSFSKSLSLPGERIGYIAVNPRAEDSDILVPVFGQISRGIGHNCPTSTMQLAVAKTLECTSDLSVYEKNRNMLFTELVKLGFEVVKPDGTFYIFARALENNALSFCKRALKYNLVLVPSDSFGVPGYFRIAYCVPTEKVERSVAAFRKFVEVEYGGN